MPLEEAARRFDSAYRLLLSAPPDDISTPEGLARVDRAALLRVWGPSVRTRHPALPRSRRLAACDRRATERRPLRLQRRFRM